MGSRGGYACVIRDGGGATTACCADSYGMVFVYFTYCTYILFFISFWFNRKFCDGTHACSPVHEHNVQQALANPEHTKLWIMRAAADPAWTLRP